ncbi:MAG TPA: PLP-dependent aminotransferase family protein [Chryseolinea sp.]|nr:PLP-dependent aminotransferase family protein [Chryseolinea sp.]
MGKITPQILVTFLSIKKKPGKTLNAQLYEQLKKGIYEGMLRAADRMPSTREMSKELKIARNIVLEVFEQLKMEGFLSSRTGSGTFISEGVDKLSYLNARVSNRVAKPLRNVARPLGLNDAFKGHASILEPIRPFQASVPLVPEFPFPLWSRISAAVYRNIDQLHLGYDDAQGYLPLRKALSDHLRISRSIKCEPENMLIVNGSRQAMHLTTEILLNKGDGCWMENPGYAGARSAIQRFGGKILPVPVGPDGIDLKYATRHYPKAKLAYVTPSHQFPMGNTMALNQRIRLLNWARDNNMWILEDDYDSEFRYNSRPLAALQGLDTHQNVIYLGTFSKVLLPALRLGYMVFPSTEMARQFSIAKSATDGQNNIIEQAIVSEFIKQGHFSRHIRRMRSLYKKAQDDLVRLIKKHLGKMLMPVPSEAGMHLLGWLPPGSDGELIAREAAKEGLIVHALSEHGIRFDHKNGLMLGFAGFTYNEMEAAVIMLKRVLQKNL